VRDLLFVSAAPQAKQKQIPRCALSKTMCNFFILMGGPQAHPALVMTIPGEGAIPTRNDSNTKIHALKTEYLRR
jgi:hypothetical protein